MKIYVLCPCRSAAESQKREMEKYVEELENEGHLVYYPNRDVNQNLSGFEISLKNVSAIANADEIHVFWHNSSTGSCFDLGVAFMLRKPVRLVKTFTPHPPERKSLLDIVERMQEVSVFMDQNKQEDEHEKKDKEMD